MSEKKGKEYRVIYEMDVCASSSRAAARKVLDMICNSKLVKFEVVYRKEVRMKDGGLKIYYYHDDVEINRRVK